MSKEFNIFGFDEKGLRKNLTYSFNEDGTVNWKSLINEQYIVPNSQNFKRKNLAVPASIEGLSDQDKLVKLAGYKDLAFKRGVKSVTFTPLSTPSNSVGVSCTIVFRGNFETDFEDISWSSTADASYTNTDDFSRRFLTCTAENRAFVRCIRNFLNIPIVGQDEMAPEENQNTENSNSEITVVNSVGPHAALSKKMEKSNMTFEKLIVKIIDSKYATAEVSQNWKTLSDIPVEIAVKILGSKK